MSEFILIGLCGFVAGAISSFMVMRWIAKSLSKNPKLKDALENASKKNN